MADQVICRACDCGVGYSIVDLHDVRHVFAAATPYRGGTFDEQADDALRTIEAVICDQAREARLSTRRCSLPIWPISTAAGGGCTNSTATNSRRSLTSTSHPAEEGCWQSRRWASARDGAKSRSGGLAKIWSQSSTTASPGCIARANVVMATICRSTRRCSASCGRYAVCWTVSGCISIKSYGRGFIWVVLSIATARCNATRSSIERGASSSGRFHFERIRRARASAQQVRASP